MPKTKKSCPKCGGPLEVRRFVDSWDANGNPADVNEDLYCPKCDIRWLEEHGSHAFADNSFWG